MDFGHSSSDGESLSISGFGSYILYGTVHRFIIAVKGVLKEWSNFSFAEGNYLHPEANPNCQSTCGWRSRLVDKWLANVGALLANQAVQKYLGQKDRQPIYKQRIYPGFTFLIINLGMEVYFIEFPINF